MLGAVARHHGVLGGKFGRGNGSRVLSPLPMLVIAEVNWPMELRYLVEGSACIGVNGFQTTHTGRWYNKRGRRLWNQEVQGHKYEHTDAILWVSQYQSCQIMPEKRQPPSVQPLLLGIFLSPYSHAHGAICRDEELNSRQLLWFTPERTCSCDRHIPVQARGLFLYVDVSTDRWSHATRFVSRRRSA